MRACRGVRALQTNTRWRGSLASQVQNYALCVCVCAGACACVRANAYVHGCGVYQVIIELASLASSNRRTAPAQRSARSDLTSSGLTLARKQASQRACMSHTVCAISVRLWASSTSDVSTTQRTSVVGRTQRPPRTIIRKLAQARWSDDHPEEEER